MSFNFCVLPDVVADENAITIVNVRAYVIARKKVEGSKIIDCDSRQEGHWILGTNEWPIANPMSIYEKYKSRRSSWGKDVIGSVIVEIELTNGITGVGISIGGEPACFIIEKHFSRFLEGQDPINIEYLWDLMWRSSINYGRKGLTIQSISAVDLALWDCLGKLRNEPVYKLLGGKTKGNLPCYATCYDPLAAKKLGFKGAKFPLPYGPADGDQGMKKNIQRIQQIREAVGPDFPLMIVTLFFCLIIFIFILIGLLYGINSSLYTQIN
jgi:L-rhamnonate dehydratase